MKVLILKKIFICGKYCNKYWYSLDFLIGKKNFAHLKLQGKMF